MGPDERSIYIGSNDLGSDISAALECGELISTHTTAAGIDAVDDTSELCCVVTDHDPPAVDCFELLETVETVPVVVAPTDGSSRLASRALRAGAETYLDPTTLDDGATAVAETIDRLCVSRTAQLQALDERIEEFSSLVSHELRNPIQKASSGIALAKTQCESEYLDEVEVTLSRMSSLIDNLLDLLDEPETQVAVEPLDLESALEEAWPTAPSATLSVESELPPLEAEPSRLYQLLENLFRNCLDHGGDDVTVRVGALSAADSDEPVGFYVADNGPGIDIEHRTEAFEYGYTNSPNGTGLGLAIVDEIANTFGWDVTLTDSETGGTRVEISL